MSAMVESKEVSQVDDGGDVVRVVPQLYRYLCILDFEATCDEGKSFGPMEVIEFPVVVLDTRTHQVVSEFHHYCRPQINPVLTPFCCSLTGIQQAQVDEGIPFAEALALLDTFLSDLCAGAPQVDPPAAPEEGGPFLFVTCGDWDLQRMLPNQMSVSGLGSAPPYLQQWANIKDLYHSHYRSENHRNAGGMLKMLNGLGLPLVGRHHSGIDDARNIARIAQRMLTDACAFHATAGFGPGGARWRSVGGQKGVAQRKGPGGDGGGSANSNTPDTSASSSGTGGISPSKGARGGVSPGDPETAARAPPPLWGPEPGRVRMCDIGANLTHAPLHTHARDVVSRAMAEGVGEIIVTGTSVQASRDALALCQEYGGSGGGVHLRCTAGIHPHDASRAMAHGLAQSIAALEALAAEHRGMVCAIGECGLDFDRNFSSRADQVAVFEAQIELAKRTALPLFLHERAAHSEFLRVLAPHAGSVRGVAHCFTGTLQEMNAYLDLGLWIGITGWVCDDRRAQDLVKAIPHLPLDRLLIETDAPYLIPRNVPREALPKHLKRSRTNEPALLPWVALRIAELRNCSLAEVVEASSRNAHALFGAP